VTKPHNNREEWRKAVDEVKADIAKHGTVEILTGPCAGMIIKSQYDVLQYAKRLDRWFFPS
jgi:hypothetical protein